ncbi:MAG: hypothetical protein ABIY52_03280, partial [Gemmatimonadaceae bacterium]
ASLDAPLPAGTTLSVAMAAPAGAASKGAKTLGTAASLDVVTGSSRLTASELPITYTVNGAAAQGAHVVTYTITSGM